MPLSPFSCDPSLTTHPIPQDDYRVPIAAPLTEKEQREVNYFLLFRQRVHDGPLYTKTRSGWNPLGLDLATSTASGPSSGGSSSTTYPSAVSAASSTAAVKTYGLEQTQRRLPRYGARDKSTVDPFLAVPSYSQRFVQPPRSLPLLRAVAAVPALFPAELRAVLEDDAGDDAARRKRIRLAAAAASAGGGPGRRRVLAPPKAQRGDEAFLRAPGEVAAGGSADADPDDDGEGVVDGEDGAGRHRNLTVQERLELISKIGGEGGEGGGAAGPDGVDDDLALDLMAAEDEEENEFGEEDEAFDDEDAGDYNAEQYFEDGDDMGDDEGAGDGDGDVY